MNSLEKSGYHRWRPAACLRVSGEDSARFLQGQITNDLQKAGSEEGVYGLWLNQKGRVLADSFVQRVSDQEHRLVSYFSPASTIRERLDAYIIADDVIVEDLTAETTGITFLDAASPPMPVPAGAGVFAGRRTTAPHVEMVFPISAEPGVLAQITGMVSIDAIEMERRRIADGIPAVPADIGSGELPNEGALEKDAISYTKGCYLGQEVMARLKSMGQVRRRLVRVSGPGVPPPRLTPVFQRGRKVGELRTTVSEGARWIGFALLTLLQVTRPEGLSLASDGTPDVTLLNSP